MADTVLFAEERKKRLVEYINEHHRVTGAQLCEAFDVSSATIRNDLKELDEQGLIVRTHGGAIKKNRSGFEVPMETRTSYEMEAKSIVAKLALAHIEHGDTILLDAGTTTCELAKLILEQHKQVTVVTNDLTVAGILEKLDSCEVLVIGGLLRKGFHCTLDNGSSQLLQTISVDKAFMGTNSFSLKGASTPDIAQASIKRNMIRIANKVILLCDHTKLEHDSFMTFATPAEIDAIITDSISEDIKKKYEENDLVVIHP